LILFFATPTCKKINLKREVINTQYIHFLIGARTISLTVLLTVFQSEGSMVSSDKCIRKGIGKFRRSGNNFVLSAV
jgi:hypothetical protein